MHKIMLPVRVDTAKSAINIVINGEEFLIIS